MIEAVNYIIDNDAEYETYTYSSTERATYYSNTSAGTTINNKDGYSLTNLISNPVSYGVQARTATRDFRYTYVTSPLGYTAITKDSYNYFSVDYASNQTFITEYQGNTIYTTSGSFADDVLFLYSKTAILNRGGNYSIGTTIESVATHKLETSHYDSTYEVYVYCEGAKTITEQVPFINYATADGTRKTTTLVLVDSTYVGIVGEYKTFRGHNRYAVHTVWHTGDGLDLFVLDKDKIGQKGESSKLFRKVEANESSYLSDKISFKKYSAKTTTNANPNITVYPVTSYVTNYNVISVTFSPPSRTIRQNIWGSGPVNPTLLEDGGDQHTLYYNYYVETVYTYETSRLRFIRNDTIEHTYIGLQMERPTQVITRQVGSNDDRAFYDQGEFRDFLVITDTLSSFELMQKKQSFTAQYPFLLYNSPTVYDRYTREAGATGERNFAHIIKPNAFGGREPRTYAKEINQQLLLNELEKYNTDGNGWEGIDVPIKIHSDNTKYQNVPLNGLSIYFQDYVKPTAENNVDVYFTRGRTRYVRTATEFYTNATAYFDSDIVNTFQTYEDDTVVYTYTSHSKSQKVKIKFTKYSTADGITGNSAGFVGTIFSKSSITRNCTKNGQPANETVNKNVKIPIEGTFQLVGSANKRKGATLSSYYASPDFGFYYYYYYYYYYYNLETTIAVGGYNNRQITEYNGFNCIEHQTLVDATSFTEKTVRRIRGDRTISDKGLVTAAILKNEYTVIDENDYLKPAEFSNGIAYAATDATPYYDGRNYIGFIGGSFNRLNKKLYNRYYDGNNILFDLHAQSQFLVN